MGLGIFSSFFFNTETSRTVCLWETVMLYGSLIRHASRPVDRVEAIKKYVWSAKRQRIPFRKNICRWLMCQSVIKSSENEVQIFSTQVFNLDVALRGTV